MRPSGIEGETVAQRLVELRVAWERLTSDRARGALDILRRRRSAAARSSAHQLIIGGATRRRSQEDGFVDATGDHVHDAIGG